MLAHPELRAEARVPAEVPNGFRQDGLVADQRFEPLRIPPRAAEDER